MPSAGPSARTGNAYLQPAASATTGTSWMVTVVRRKPTDVWRVGAVPTASGRGARVTSGENWPLSGIPARLRTRSAPVGSNGAHQNAVGDRARHSHHTHRATM